MVLQKTDKEIADIIKGEEKRQREGLEMIPSENYVSAAVREAVGSVLENKYAEGYPRRRYYTGNEFVDQVEQVAQERAKSLFGVPFVNVQAYSGSPANLEIFGALISPVASCLQTTSDEAGQNGQNVVLSQELSSGGHLSMGQEASFTSKYYRAAYYHLTEEGEVDWVELDKLARKYKPKIIWSGGTAYTKIFQWEKYAAIADEAGAYFVADISHIAGLVAGGAHPSPVPFAHVVMTTTHKTLRGPRGALIIVTDKGLKKDPELPEKINKSVFPGHQGGPHMNKIAGIAVALGEASTADFKKYALQIVKNAKTLADELRIMNYELVGGGTENHMIWMDLGSKGLEGWHAHVALEAVNIYGNKQTIPNDPRPPFYPSGYRIGTPAITTRGMEEKEMKVIAGFINEGLEIAREVDRKIGGIGSKDKEKDQKLRRMFKEELKMNKKIASLKKKVIDFAREFLVP